MRRCGNCVQLLLTLSCLYALPTIPSAEAGEQLLDGLQREMTQLVQRVRPSVVSVVAYCQSPQCTASQLSSSPGEQASSASPASLWQKNIGSGCIIDATGHIVTTENVIHQAQEIEVTFSDGTSAMAHLVGTDAESNLAVLRVDGRHTPPATMGNSDGVQVGSLVTIVGNSFGLTSAVSFGLVNGIRDKDELIQLSAPVNPGNSGAVVLNTKGEVIGLVVAAVSEPITLMIGAAGTAQPQVQQLDLRSQGASLAIPMRTVQAVAASLIDRGVYERGWLGVTIRDLSAEQMKRLNVTSGVLVIQVLDPSPAAEAHLTAGDVILQYDGKPVTKAKDLFHWVQASPAGTPVPLVISRNGQQQTLSAQIIRRPDDLNERLAKAGNPQAFPVTEADQNPASANVSPGDAFEKRIERLEEEIRQLRKLIRQEK